MVRKENKKITSRKNRPKRKARLSFAIVVEGKTEFWYFNMMKRNEEDLLKHIKLEPKTPPSGGLLKHFQKVKKLAKNNDKVFWIIDLDKVIQDGKEETLKTYLAELRREDFEKVITIFNNPCLEFWFLLHYEHTTRFYRNCDSVRRRLKKFMQDYKKTKDFFVNQNEDIYSRLKPHLNYALENTRHTQRTNLNDLQRAICEMNLFFETGQIGEIIFGEK